MCDKQAYRDPPGRPSSPPPRSAWELYQAARDLWEKRQQELDADE